MAYLGLYALLRFVVEMFRGDVIRGLVVALETPRLAGWLHLPPHEPIFLSVGQLGSLVVLALCAVVWKRLRRAPLTVSRPAGGPPTTAECQPFAVTAWRDRNERALRAHA